MKAPIAEVIDILTYHNYRHNRLMDATLPADWYLIYGKEMVDTMEKRYQKERHTNVHPVFREILAGVSNAKP